MGEDLGNAAQASVIKEQFPLVLRHSPTRQPSAATLPDFGCRVHTSWKWARRYGFPSPLVGPSISSGNAGGGAAKPRRMRGASATEAFSTARRRRTDLFPDGSALAPLIRLPAPSPTRGEGGQSHARAMCESNRRSWRGWPREARSSSICESKCGRCGTLLHGEKMRRRSSGARCRWSP